MLINTPEIRGKKDHWYAISSAGKALTVSEAAQAFEGVTVLLTDSARSANEIESEIHFFINGEPSNTDKNIPVLHFPDWETLPYDLFSPHQDIVSERLRVLHQLPTLKKGILVVPTSTLMHRLPPANFLQAKSFLWRTGQHLDINQLRSQLEHCGYHAVETVFEHGEYATRGSIIDVFPMGSSQPVRIDLFDNQIESLRYFDPESQRTIEQVKEISLLPAKEVDLDDCGIKRFKDNWHLQFDANPKDSSLYTEVSRGIAPQGVEYYLPLFFDETTTLFSYLPKNCQFICDGNIEQAASQFWDEVKHRHSEYGVDRQRPLLNPEQVFTPTPELFQRLGLFNKTQLHEEPATAENSCNLNLFTPQDISVDQQSAKPLAQLEDFLYNTSQRILFCAESAGRKDALESILARIDVTPKLVTSWYQFATTSDLDIAITVFPLGRGVSLPQAGITVITETELFGQKVLQSRRRYNKKDQSEQAFQQLTELTMNAPVVHLEHGVGRYKGLQTIAAGGMAQEFLTLEYANGSQLYVPVASLQLISRYSGTDPDLAPLHRLGSEKWQKSKDKALKKLRDTATELLEIYAKRAAKQGVSLQSPEQDYQAFCEEFPFEETPDQIQAIDAVKRDLASQNPMDRLICGDVGFGKTEVAMRAAFIAVASGKQVILLVPTTLLAHQHTENFRDRFSNWPVRVEELSRFKTAKEQQQIMDAVDTGHVDILIGTHKLLNADIHYKELGLLIIDEEHRFGVNQKEKIKALRSQSDILTMTATPIPRTLNMSMAGMRDLSIIATPPAKRLSVKTFVREHEDRLIKEAILRELLRGGQVYFLHNDVKSIERAAADIQQMIPEARIGIGHGQMRERELEHVMSEFYHQRFNLLVCTTIIETGIDIPSANTIIISRADKFGLAQLHQLRGRVGRSHHQAYAYMLTPHPKAMTKDALKRLEAIEAADHLGAGFTLATHDMEIRGAGELLGDEQSGHIQAIGFTLYMELLQRAVEALQNGKDISDDLPLMDETEVNLNIPAIIPADYLPDVHTRLIIYKRIASASSEQQLQEMKVEMIDRFGLLPEHVKNLFRVTSLKLDAKELGIKRVEASQNGGKVEFSNDTRVEPMTIIQLVQKEPKSYKFEGATTLRFSMPLQTAEQRFGAVQQLLETFSGNA